MQRILLVRCGSSELECNAQYGAWLDNIRDETTIMTVDARATITRRHREGIVEIISKVIVPANAPALAIWPGFNPQSRQKTAVFFLYPAFASPDRKCENCLIRLFLLGNIAKQLIDTTNFCPNALKIRGFDLFRGM
jgi:hypothetical protein